MVETCGVTCCILLPLLYVEVLIHPIMRRYSTPRVDISVGTVVVASVQVALVLFRSFCEFRAIFIYGIVVLVDWIANYEALFHSVAFCSCS